MPTDLIHRIGIAAPVGTIYRALTTGAGSQARWTTDVKLDEVPFLPGLQLSALTASQPE